jgi:HAD superfamily phosphoserine phosphatase-like hydrolase
MNTYDFDKTIYNGDSTKDFYIFCLKRHKKIIKTFPSLIVAFSKFYIFKKGSKTDFKQVMYKFLHYVDINKDLPDFWESHKDNIKDWYYKQQRDDDVIISASPEFLLKPICNMLGIKHLMASIVDPKTGKYTGLNCHGQEKVRRFYEKFPNGKIEEFYSDSYSDSPLAEISQKAFLVQGDNLKDL